MSIFAGAETILLSYAQKVPLDLFIFGGAMVEEIFGRPGPELMTEGFDPWAQPFVRSYHPESPLDRAIMDTREAVFPHWGLVADPFGAF